MKNYAKEETDETDEEVIELDLTVQTKSLWEDETDVVAESYSSVTERDSSDE